MLLCHSTFGRRVGQLAPEAHLPILPFEPPSYPNIGRRLANVVSVRLMRLYIVLRTSCGYPSSPFHLVMSDSSSGSQLRISTFAVSYATRSGTGAACAAKVSPHVCHFTVGAFCVSQIATAFVVVLVLLCCLWSCNDGFTAQIMNATEFYIRKVEEAQGSKPLLDVLDSLRGGNPIDDSLPILKE